MSRFSYVLTFQFTSLPLTSAMMDKIDFGVDEIVSTCATGVQYTYIHLKKKAKEDSLVRALKMLESDGVKGSEIYGYNFVDGNAPSVSEHLEDHPGFQTLVDHEMVSNCAFSRWTADGYRSDGFCGYNLLKNKLLAKRAQSVRRGGEQGSGTSVGSIMIGGPGGVPVQSNDNGEGGGLGSLHSIMDENNDGQHKRRRVGSLEDQDTDYFKIAMDKLNSTVSSAITSAVSSSGSVMQSAFGEVKKEQKLREQVEKELQEIKMQQKLCDERRRFEEELKGKYDSKLQEAETACKKLECKLLEMQQTKVGYCY